MKLIATGIIKEKKYLDLINDYIKRIHFYHPLAVSEIKESRLTEQDVSKSQKQQALLIKKKIDPRDYLVALDLRGRAFNSQQFATWLEKKLSWGQPLCFLMGGSIGLPPQIRAHESLSFSPLTFPHKLFRIIFLEQLYRSLTIINGDKYHK